MYFQEFYRMRENIITKPAKLIFENPLILTPFIFFYMVLLAYKPIALIIAPNLLTNLQNIIYFASYGVIFLLFSSYILAFSVSLISSKIKGKKQNNFKRANSSFLKVFLLNLFFIVIFNLVQLVSFQSALSIGNYFSLDAQTAALVVFLFLFLGLLIFLAPISIAPFTLVSREQTLKNSLSSSFRIFINNLQLIVSLIVFFVIISWTLDHYLSSLSPIVVSFIEIVLLASYLVTLLTYLSIKK